MIETTVTTRPERRFRVKPVSRAAALTVERAAYVVLVGLAFGLRLYALSHRPLAPDEARNAADVWRFAHGLLADPANYTPPLFYTQLLVLLITGANDLTARIPVLLFGTALVGLPYYLRSWLGRAGALAAAALLAVSPVLTFFSRTDNEAIVTAALVLALLAAAARYGEEPERRRLLWLAAALGVALTGGPGVTTFALAVLVYMVLSVLASRPAPAGEVETGGRTAGPLVIGRGTLSAALDALRADPAGLRQAGLLLVCVYLLAATGWLVNFGGLQAALNGVVAWLGQLGGPSTGPGPATASQILLIYDPLILGLGLAGAVVAAWRRHGFGLFLCVWLALAWLVATVAGQKAPGLVVPVVLPLSLLAGWALGQFVETLARHATLGLDGLLAALTGILAAYGLLQFVGYAAETRQLYINLGLVALAFVVGLAILFGFAWGPGVALRGVGITALIVLALLTFHAGTWLNYRNQDVPQEWLLPNSASRDVRRLVDLMHSLSYQSERDPDTMAVTVQAELMPALGWYLRDFEAVTPAQSVGAGVQTPLVLVPARPDLANLPGYVGQRFRIGTVWTPADLRGLDLWRWYFFRGAAPSGQPVDVILYEKR